MYEAIVFLPLLGAFIAGIFGPIIGARASTYVTSGFMVLVAILSAIAFANVAIYEGPKPSPFWNGYIQAILKLIGNYVLIR